MWYAKSGKAIDLKEATNDEIQKVQEEEERLMAEAL